MIDGGLPLVPRALPLLLRRAHVRAPDRLARQRRGSLGLGCLIALATACGATGCGPVPVPIAVANATTDLQRVLVSSVRDGTCALSEEAALGLLSNQPLQELVIVPNEHAWLEGDFPACGYVRLLTEQEQEYVFSFHPVDDDSLFSTPKGVIRLDGAAELVEPTTNEMLELTSTRRLAWNEPMSCTEVIPLPSPTAPSAESEGPSELLQVERLDGCTLLRTAEGDIELCGAPVPGTLVAGTAIEWTLETERESGLACGAPSPTVSLELRWEGTSFLWRRAPLSQFPVPRQSAPLPCVGASSCHVGLELRDTDGVLIERAELPDGALLEVLQVELAVDPSGYEDSSEGRVVWTERRGAAL